MSVHPVPKCLLSSLYVVVFGFFIFVLFCFCRHVVFLIVQIARLS